ncbi:MFS general substrate transporter [Corynespora cassiicola Philippines]|uniref:MFS general substrate transporter n=1 Tax=Corynespora cassiicola Philippines TaxID=1448308 RepID=A0A2T2N722_CORCC|nr:MFS general substrate transporter [Corynespora cassiicola Philippines]
MAAHSEDINTSLKLPEKYAFESKDGETSNYLTGLKLHIVTFGLCLGLYLVNLEMNIISTFLIAITNSLRRFDQSRWILTTGFIIIWAKLRDVFGRKTCSLTTMAIFTIFSGACGAAQNMTQLIIFLAFQKIGAAGGFALAIVIIQEMVPKDRYPGYGALMAADMALATLSGPLFGGIISSNSTWKWTSAKSCVRL